MTPRMYFTLVLRGIGTWKVLEGLEYFVTSLNVQTGHYNAQLSDPKAFAAHGAVDLVAGLALVFGAAAIAAMVVPPVRAPGKDGSGDDGIDA